jgi:hypothetical protein
MRDGRIAGDSTVANQLSADDELRRLQEAQQAVQLVT